MMKILLLGVLWVQVLGLPSSHDDPSPRVLGPPMTLTPGDLKRFSGHALKLLQTKCPKVKAATIFELNKFIAKAIARDTNPIPGDDAVFREIIKSVTTCTKEVAEVKPEEPEVVEEEPVDADGPSFFFFANPFVPDVKGDDGTPDEASGFKVGPEAGTPHLPKDSTEGQPKKSQPFFGWIHNLFTSVRDYFKSFFEIRNRRSLGAAPAPSSSAMHQGGVSGEGAEVTPTGGKGTFTELFDAVCRVYCDKCTSPSTSQDQFKSAAKELLEHLFKIVPTEGLELAATHHLTKEFMQTVKECE